MLTVGSCHIVQIVLAKMAYAQWLKVHGKLKRPELSKKQELELKECFELIDAGGSGTFDQGFSSCFLLKIANREIYLKSFVR